MAEDAGEIKTKEAGISRRDFLKSGAKKGAIALGLVAGGALINAAETSAVENGISTESGTFFPLYETHYESIDSEKIQKDLDVLFREGIEYLPRFSPKDLLTLKGAPYGNPEEPVTRWPDKMLKELGTNGTEIMTGDVWLGSLGSASHIMQGLEFFTGIACGLLVVKKAKENTNITRRILIKAGGIAAATWLTGYGAYFLSRGGLYIGKFNAERENALNRVLDRVFGLQSNLHPEEMGTFFRNLMITNKMLTVAEDIKQKTGKKAKIGFNVEYAHNGIEDFLKLGHGICRWMISMYPKEILNTVANTPEAPDFLPNGGIEGLWTSRLLKLPKDFFEQDPEKRWEQVSDRKVVDLELKQMLEKKLA